MNKNTKTARNLILAGILIFLLPVTATADEQESVEAAILAQGNAALAKMSKRMLHNDWNRQIVRQLAQALRSQAFSPKTTAHSECTRNIISLEGKKPADAAFPFHTAGVMQP